MDQLESRASYAYDLTKILQILKVQAYKVQGASLGRS
jgi:hypothetical protein